LLLCSLVQTDELRPARGILLAGPFVRERQCMYVAQKLSCLPATVGKETSCGDCRVLLRQVRLEGLVRSVRAEGAGHVHYARVERAGILMKSSGSRERSSILLFLVPQIREQLYRGWPMTGVVVVGEGE
jgi:hypothetical protein